MMTAKTPEKEARKLKAPSPPTNIAAVKMALPPRVDYERLTPALALPPGVYFDPTEEEVVRTYLNGWIAGHERSSDADAEAALVIEDDVYSDRPDVLARKYPPASTRDSEPSWWFRCHCKLQATRDGVGHRGGRIVATGGTWKLEQTKKEVRCPVDGEHLGFKRSFGFHAEHEGQKKKKKTLWLMEEYTNVDYPDETTVRDDGRSVLPALYRIYISPNDPVKKKRKKMRGRGDGDDPDNGGPVKVGRVMVPKDYLRAAAALLSPSSFRGAGQEEPQGGVEALPPPSGFSSQYQGEAASTDDDHGVSINENNLHDEAQGSTGGDDSPEPRVLVTMNDGVPALEMDMGGRCAFADTCWIDEHYQNME
uniref:NAC domain-containing protein n=2 Tax=Hordeum vulgare subsp. vulgare TaxID=112509 RepID=A0A8I7BIK6_HORVV